MSDILDDFGSMVFNKSAMKRLLPEDAFKSLVKSIDTGTQIEKKYLNIIAKAMQDWAISKGATHYTHWFQPMVGLTAGKHDSFISKNKEGQAILNFSGDQLIKGEPDASSFPSGGLRTTFEARGYTAWDPTSYTFVKDKTLYIPTVFYSFSGDMLDKKTPLLKSMELINKESLRVLRLFGDKKSKRVIPTVGAEQEYFLIDRELYKKRPDLYFCKRTLFGKLPPKCQETDAHYLGTTDRRVADFMVSLDKKLWSLGIFAKTKHNEVAPAQYELAPIYTSANLAADQNFLTMEVMRTTAREFGFECILHEKPFNGINGSGKHNNWSLTTDTGENLFDVGKSKTENARFLLFLCAVIKAVDTYQELLRAACANAGNDLRLGGEEAPPAIISVYLGDEIQQILESIERGESYSLKSRSIFKMGVDVLPNFFKDNTDRNRTSPFAFTGNKFEFRMVGSSSSISEANTVLNVAVAEILKEFSNQLEKSSDFNTDLEKILRDTIKNHKRIIFNGDNYSLNWQKEAEKRGLYNLKSSAKALPQLVSKKSLDLFTKSNVYSEKELKCRYCAKAQNYYKIVTTEAKVLLEMCKNIILPAALKYKKILINSITEAKNIEINSYVEQTLLKEISAICINTYENLKKLEKVCLKINNTQETLALEYCENNIIPLMKLLRGSINSLEDILPKDLWPYPTYADLLYSVSNEKSIKIVK